MLPRRCKKCRCYVAPQLKRCPRCNKVVPSNVVVKPTKEEKQAARVKLDDKLPTIHAKKMRWRPSDITLKSHHQLVDEVKRKIARADTARARNALRSELRVFQAVVKPIPHPEKCWTTETRYDHHGSIPVFISPKGRRYVLAEKDEAASLIIINRKRAPFPRSRLVRFEQSEVFGRIKLAEKHAKQAAEKKAAKEKDKDSDKPKKKRRKKRT